MTSELKPNYVKFAHEICQFAFEGCDADGFSIQEIGVKCGVLKVEAFDQEKHTNIVNSEDFEAGEDVYLFVEPRAVPDVPELVRYSMIDVTAMGQPWREMEEDEFGEYVRYVQAAAIIADLRLQLENERDQQVHQELASVKAKLSEYEKQEPVAWQHAVTYPDGVKYIGVISKESKQQSRPLYASPAPAADMKAENEELRGQTMRVIIAFDPDNDLDSPEKFNAYHDLEAALKGDGN